MYFYKFESIDYEEQYSFELTHHEKFNSEELDEMVLKAIKTYIKEEYNPYLSSPCYLDIGDLFYDGSLQTTLIELFGFKEIKFECKVEYNGESLFNDDFRHKDGKNFKEILSDVDIPKCDICINDKCLIENKRF